MARQFKNSMVCSPATSETGAELDGQDPFQISGLLCQTRKTPTLVGRCVYSEGHINEAMFVSFHSAIYNTFNQPSDFIVP
jgi:hypothetical protein